MGSNEADIFANTLKKRNVQTPAALYRENKNVTQNTIKEYKVQDVISNISKQIKAFQNADNNGKGGSRRNFLDKHKTSNFLPITMISTEQPSEPIQSNNFETQCVLDTQLIHIIENAEALIDVPENMTQEFDNSFNKLDSNRNNDPKIKTNEDTGNKNSDDSEDKDIINEMSSHRKVYDNDSFNTLSSKFNDTCNLSNVNKDKEVNTKIALGVNEVEDHDEDIPRSLIISKYISPILKSKTPLVYKLESFEKFETIAVPIINDNLDFDVAKRLINSQIKNNELFIQTHAEPVLGDRDKSPSPILNICNKPHITSKDFHKIKTKSVSFIEDKLLFSSDEEDNFKNGFEELPLTCALETSFYKQNDVLDKTMYVGFQTASNKSIQVNSDSYSKAKSILDNVKIHEEEFSLSKLVEVFDSTSKSNNNTIETKDNESILLLQESNNCHNNVLISPIAGFRTGSGKHIKISEAAIMKSKRIFEEVLEADIAKDLLDINVNNDISCNKKVKLTEDTLDLREMNAELNTQLNFSAEDNGIYTGLDEVGLLNELVNIDEHIINEFESNFIINDKDKDSYGKTLDDTATSTIKTINNNIDNRKVVIEGPFIGFKTANDKEIKISEQGLAKTKNIFEDINLTDLEKPLNDMITDKFNSYKDQPSTSKNFMGFRTATNKRIEVSELALAKTKNIFDNIDNEDLPVDKIVPIKQLPVSVNKNKIEANINKNNLANLSNKSNGFVNPFPTNNNVNEIFKKPSLPEKLMNANHDIAHQIPSFIGFQTASNKPVQISSEALAKSERVFKEIMSVTNDKGSYEEVRSPVRDSNIVNKLQNTKKKHDTVRSQETLSDITEDVSKSANEIDRQSNNSQDISPWKCTTKMIGFKTASNKTVAISDEALAKTKSIFQDMFNTETKIANDDIVIEDKKTFDSINKGFRTASNEPVSLTEEGLTKSKDIIRNFETFERQTTSSVFEGFKTASNKGVQISETALAKTRKIFQEIDMDDAQGQIVKQKNAFSGFKTANNETVKISKEALLKSKQLFEGIDLNQDEFYDNKTDAGKNKNEDTFAFKTANNKHVNISEDSLRIARNNLQTTEEKTPDKNQFNIEDIMNTEVMKNLEQSLYTEDFSKDTSPVSKRSGSPILSCPKAKKRKKFKTPQTINKINVPNSHKTERPIKTYIYDENYKKNKIYTLKDLKDFESSNSNNANIDPYVLNFKFDTLLDFEFGAKRNDIDSDIWSTDKILKRFTESVNTKIVPEGWIENHLKLIIWKLLWYEYRFPYCMNNICTVKNVLQQLKYRYDRELYNVERPALRKILEKDELASKLLVLSVVGLYVNNICVSSVTNQMQNIELLVTDGWYCIKACADRMVDRLISAGKIRVGTKLAIYGAELMNCEQGVSPWEDTSLIRLKISGNSTRRAKWDARLGFHGNGAILARLSAVKPEGGKVSRVRIFVTRVYPTLYIEKFADGSTVTRSERLEHIEQMKHETDRQNQIEKLYDEIEKMGEQESQDSESLDSDKGLDTGSQICRLMKRSNNLSGFKVNLTESQTHLLEEHAIKKRERLLEKMQAKVQDMVKKRGLDVARNVVPLLKMRVADVHNDSVSKAMITIWRPNECVLDLIAEGAWLDVYNIVPTAVRFSEVQISAGRQSIFQLSKFNKSKTIMYTDTLKRKCHPIKDLQHVTNTDSSEIDTFGLVFLIEPPTNQYQNIYLTDESKNIISINFWGGIKKFGFENILDTGQIVACLNLQKRTGNTRNEIAQYRATEFSHFTRTCKIGFIRKMTEELSAKFLSIDMKKFINDCVVIKNNLINLKYGNTENVTPYRLNNSDYNVSRNRLFIESPLAQKVDINLNLSGLDFESTFKQTDTQELSPKQLARKRKVNQRIAKLKMYGEPPPLSSIHIINKSNSIKPYKSPLITKSDISINVASANKLPENVELNSSPLLNRTYVKCINPVKLNFTDEDKDGNTTDPFAEEFDCSPPLSLE